MDSLNDTGVVAGPAPCRTSHTHRLRGLVGTGLIATLAAMVATTLGAALAGPLASTLEAEFEVQRRAKRGARGLSRELFAMSPGGWTGPARRCPVGRLVARGRYGSGIWVITSCRFSARCRHVPGRTERSARTDRDTPGCRESCPTAYS